MCSGSRVLENITVHNLFGEGTPVAAFQCLTMMMRDLPDPLASAYAHLHLACRAQLLLPPDAGCVTQKNTFSWFCHSLKVEICHRTGWCIICPCGLESKNAVAMGSSRSVLAINPGLNGRLDNYFVLLFANYTIYCGKCDWKIVQTFMCVSYLEAVKMMCHDGKWADCHSILITGEIPSQLVMIHTLPVVGAPFNQSPHL